MPEFNPQGPAGPQKKDDDKEEITESLENTQKIVPAEILDGKDANGVDFKNLTESMRHFKLASGDEIWAGTYRGIGYKNNEDRAISTVLFPEKD